MLCPLDPSQDLRLSGHVIYTGTSSMEVAIKMEAISQGKEEETVLLANTNLLSNQSLPPLGMQKRFASIGPATAMTMDGSPSRGEPSS
ncbi:hypothetical protein C8R45DRAFT_1154864 [Mycena sanguinolenta]|nr:hypothetical protein C8R45DRAFT_1154864 [Mycena sanguinolenta]